VKQKKRKNRNELDRKSKQKNNQKKKKKEKNCSAYLGWGYDMKRIEKDDFFLLFFLENIH